MQWMYCTLDRRHLAAVQLCSATVPASCYGPESHRWLQSEESSNQVCLSLDHKTLLAAVPLQPSLPVWCCSDAFGPRGGCSLPGSPQQPGVAASCKDRAACSSSRDAEEQIERLVSCRCHHSIPSRHQRLEMCTPLSLTAKSAH